MTVSHDKIKNRIVDILKADNNVFDDGKTEGKLNEIYVGQRFEKVINGSDKPPFLYVTNGNPILQKIPKGVISDNTQSYFENTARYMLNFVSTTKAVPVEAEKELDDIELLVSTALENNFELNNPVDNDDPVCISSFIERVDSILFTAKKGRIDQGRTITLQLKIISK